MSEISNLPIFPHTIGNLDDDPNLPADEMKAALERDCMEMWEKLREVIPELNSKALESDIVNIINASSTHGTIPTAKAVYNLVTEALVGDDGAKAAQIISDWLDDHPDATTTVEDGAVSFAKLSTGASASIAPKFNTAASYSVGRMVVYNDALYKCIVAHDAGAWNADHFTLADAGTGAGAANVGVAKLYDTFPKVTLSLVQGNIISDGTINSTNTGVRSASNYASTPIIQKGDCIIIDPPYTGRGFVYNDKAFTSGNFVASIGIDANGAIKFPDAYVGKYAAVTVSKFDYSGSLASEIDTIKAAVRYCRPEAMYQKVTDAEAKVKSILPLLDSFHFVWHVGYTVTSSGVYGTNSKYAATDIIPVTPGNMIVNRTPTTGDDSQETMTMIARYADDVFISGSRAEIGYNATYVIPSGTNGIRFIYGYTSANESPLPMTRYRLDKYFSVQFLNEAQLNNSVGDGERPVYVAFGASTVAGAVHHMNSDPITYSPYNFPRYLGKVLNMKAYNVAVGSTGLIERGDHGSADYGTKLNVMDSIMEYNAILNHARLVTIMFAYGNDHMVGSPATRFPVGSYTDYYPYDEEGYHPLGAAGINTMLSKGATVMGCLNWCIRYLNTHYPKAKVVVIFGSPSANTSRRVTMASQSEGYGTAPYTLTFPEDPYRDAVDHTSAAYGVYLIHEELKKLRAAMNVDIIDMYYEGNAFTYYSTYAKDPDDPTLYALFSTTGTSDNPTFNTHPNDAGYEYFARYVAGKVAALFTH